MSPVDYGAAGQLSPEATLIVVYGVAFVLLAAIVHALLRGRRHAQRAQAATESVQTKQPAAKGYAVLRGTVETEAPERPAIVVTLTEVGTEKKHKNKWTHAWTETHREVRQEPFYLVLASGTRVRVEPGDDVFLVDKLELVRRGNPRTRRASLDNGELAYVSGLVEEGYHPRADEGQGGPYRGAIPTGHVLRRGPERMLVSTEPLARRPQRIASAHRWMALLLAVALLLANGVVFGSTHMVHLFGENTELAVQNTRTWTTTNKNSVTTHYAVVAAYPASTGEIVSLDGEVNLQIYSLARNNTLTKMPFRVVPSHPSYFAVGTGPTHSGLMILLAVGLFLVLVLIYRALLDNAREWYDRKLVVETGSGRLKP